MELFAKSEGHALLGHGDRLRLIDESLDLTLQQLEGSQRASLHTQIFCQLNVFARDLIARPMGIYRKITDPGATALLHQSGAKQFF